MSANKANETVYDSNLDSPNTRNSLIADFAQNQHIVEFEKFQAFTHCQNLKKACIIFFVSAGYKDVAKFS
jgi:hypothetical protein